MTEKKIDNPDISIVIPVYGSDSTLNNLYVRIVASMVIIPASFEIIFVDDCGPGNPWDLISEIARNDSRVIGLRLTKNFGQHNAIMAGVDVARGSWLVIMDCDLQDRPEEIPRLFKKAQEGYDIVAGQRINRRDSYFKRLFSRAYHRLFGYMTNQKSDETQSSFGIYSRRAIDAVKSLPEQPRIFPLLVRWFAFKTTAIEIQHDERTEGKSSYNYDRRLSLAIDTIVSYSEKPLILFIKSGFIMSFAAFCYGVWLVIQYFILGQIIAGWTSVMVSMFFLSGVILFGMGVVGVYIGKILNQVKGRPPYVVNERTTLSFLCNVYNDEKK
ncbi:MAG: glycosyltransferase family 2 protein [Syntrophales bacterium]